MLIHCDHDFIETHLELVGGAECVFEGRFALEQFV
jgi:hypothetical protein